MQGPVSIAHVVAAVLCVIELGLTGYVASRFDGFVGGSSPDSVNFMVFNSVWSLLVLVYIGFVPLYYDRFFHKLISLGLESITCLFWFAGSIAMAAKFGNPTCGTDTSCGTVKAGIAFGFFIWLIFCALVAIDTLNLFRTRRTAVTADGAHAHPKPAAQPYSGV
jgi:hypothetical protein